MPDVFTRKKRSEVMSRIRSRGNKETEITLMRLLRRHKISGWRRHAIIRIPARAAHLPPFTVRPDFVFRTSGSALAPRLALFVDGCYWHACPKHGTKPKNNRAFWRKKLNANKRRDKLVNRALRRARWRVLRIWEHDLHPKTQTRLVRRIHRVLI
jgi:DNA mismatch endonuclease (patch repair protein)